MKSIVLKESLVFGWETLRNNFGLYLKLLITLIVITVIPTLILGKISASLGGLLGLPLQFLNLVWQAIVGMGVVKICLKLYDNQSVEVNDLWSCLPSTLDYIVVKIAYTVIVTVGLILLIVPGLIWAMQFYLASYLVIDRRTGVVAALKNSSAITHGAKWDLGVFVSVLLLVNVLGILCLGIGLLITLPVTLLAGVHVYRKLLAQTEASGAL